MKEESEPFWPLIITAAVLAVAVFVISMSIEWWGNTVLRSVLITAVVLMVLADIQIARYYRRKKAEGVPLSDERLEKMVIYASAYSWRVGIFFMIVIILLDLARVIALDVVTVLSASVLVMAGAYFAFYWYFGRKGDV